MLYGVYTYIYIYTVYISYTHMQIHVRFIGVKNQQIHRGHHYETNQAVHHGLICKTSAVGGGWEELSVQWGTPNLMVQNGISHVTRD